MNKLRPHSSVKPHRRVVALVVAEVRPTQPMSAPIGLSFMRWGSPIFQHRRHCRFAVRTTTSRERTNKVMGILLDTLSKNDPSVRNCTADNRLSPEASRAVMKDWHPGVDSTPLVKRSGSYTKTAAGTVSPDAYDTGHDTADSVSALGSMSGDTSQQDQDDATMDTVMVDATLFDEKARQLVQSAGAAYSYKAAIKTGLAKRIDPELLATVQYLEKHAALLNKAVRITNARLAKQGKPPLGSGSGSQSGSASGSASGSVSSDGRASGDLSKVDRNVVIRALAGQIADRLRLMGRA